MAQKWFLANPNPHIKIIEQIVCRDTAHLNQFLENVIESGGEGVVIRDANTTYHTGRSADILKVKKFEDMEGRVIAVNISKKTGKLGSVKLRLESGVEFKLGNGFHGLLAKNPPKIGDIVTFKYYGFTSNGVPRFASFMRIRRD
jgi:DNA ligase-1